MSDMRHGGSERMSPCGCRRDDDICENLPVLAFLTVQKLDCVFEPELGFKTGTIFPALEKPLKAGRCGQ